MSTEAIQQAVQYFRANRDTQLATVDGDQPWVRAMYLAKVDDDGTLWYATNRDSAKARQITANPKVCVSAYSGQAEARIFGVASLVDDRQAKEAIWSPLMEKYYASIDDPKMLVIKITPMKAEIGFMD